MFGGFVTSSLKLQDNLKMNILWFLRNVAQKM